MRLAVLVLRPPSPAPACRLPAANLAALLASAIGGEAVTADLAALRTLATQAHTFDADDLSAVEVELLARDTGEALLTVLDEIEVLRSQVTGIANARPVEAPPAPPPGFTGTRLADFGSAVDGAHVVRLALYRFPTAPSSPTLSCTRPTTARATVV